MIHLMREAGNGALVIIAPKKVLRKLDVETTDKGYLSRRLNGVSIYSSEFEDAFRDFVEHTDNDRWPDNYHDEPAQGRPKDGCILLLPNGIPVKCAAKILGLAAPFQWPNH